MSLWEVARDRGNQIARELRLRKSSELVHPHNRRVFDKVLAELARDPAAPALGRLQGLYDQVRRRSELQTALILLELAWRLTPKSRLEEDVVRMICRCYQGAPQPEWQQRIRDELRDRQSHPFPSVRRVVHLVRQHDPVDETEILELRDMDRGYADVRQSVAERVILHRQVAHLEAVIVYLGNLLGSADEEERVTAKTLFAQIANQFKGNEEALRVTYPKYLAAYEQYKELRGFLMEAIARYGDSIVPQLVFDHEMNPGDRRSIEHVLSKILSNGGAEATRALLCILTDARGTDITQVCRLLQTGLGTLAARANKIVGAYAVRDAVDKAVPALERRSLPDIQQFLVFYATLEWGIGSVDEIVSKIIDGTASEQHRQQLRRAAKSASYRLIAAAEDGTRDLTERCRALSALGQLSAAATPEIGVKLWSIFTRDAPTDNIRVAVVRALAALELDPGPEAREILFTLIHNGPASLAKAIHTEWSRIFRAAALTDSGKNGARDQ